MRCSIVSACLFVAAGLNFSASQSIAQEQPKPPVEADYYKLLSYNLPEKQVLEIGAMEKLPDGRIVFCTRRGEIWMVENAFTEKPEDAKFTRFAHGLHETLGITWNDGWLYVTQRCEVSRLKDTNNDGVADLFETVNSDWEINGDYHEYAFGSKFDKKGDMWVVLCLTGSFSSEVKYRGWCLRVNKDGKMTPTCSGIRSPGGIGMDAEENVFYTDNQGPWNGTCELKHLAPGTFQGHPGGNKWYDLPEAKAAMGARPRDPESGSRFMVESDKIPEYMPPVILFPYGRMGQSASGIACDTTGGKFGPFAKQLFVGDQTFSTVMRCCLEKVDGKFQGACFPFRAGFGSGTLPVEITKDGSMLVGGTNRGWGSRGPKPFALERLVWTGKVPFEVHEMRAKPDGFELTFTHPVDPATASDPKSYTLDAYTYIFQASYGSPIVDESKPAITRIDVAADGKSARLFVEGLKRGHIHELHLDGVRSKGGLPVLHPAAYYTLNNIPKS
ncbi:MAG: hypothetical protein IT428_08770 [Planctomycetaceae bacterium]|nr:hypothetical protein [Planctomycetaceae bacterium]